MASNRVVKVEILGDAKSLASAFGSAGNAAGKFGSTIGDIAKVAGGFVIGQGLMKLPGLFSDAVSAGSNLEESLNAVNQIFGSSAQTILDWGANSANSFGLSQRAFNDLAVPLGAGLKNAGLSMEDVSAHTINLTERAADMASVFNTDVDEALAAIQAGLRGEADPLERYGVGLSAAAVEAEALAMTGKGLASELTNEEKALARVNLIMKQTEDVAGDFANTSDGAANSARIAAAKQEELAAAIGQKLLPVQQALNNAKLAFLTIVADKVLPALTVLVNRLSGPLSTAFSLVRDGVLTFVQALQGNWSDNENIHGLHRVIGNVGLVIREQVIPAVMSMAAFFQDTLWPIIQQGVGFVGQIVAAFTGGGEGGGLTGALSKVGEVVGQVAPLVLEKLGELVVSIGDWIVNTGVPMLAEKLGAWADAFGAWAVEAVPPMLESLGTLLDSLGTWFADTGLPTLLEKLGQWGQALVDWVGPRIQPTLQALGQLLLAIDDWIITHALPEIVGKLAEWGAQFVAWVQPQIGPLLAELGSLLSSLGSWLIDTALPEIGAKLGEWGTAFIAWVGPKIPPLLAELGSLLVSLGDWLITTALPEITAKLGQWGAEFVAWVAPQIPPLLTQLGVLLMEVAAWIISDGVPKLVEKLAEWGVAFVGWVADVLIELPRELSKILSTINGWVLDKAATIAGYGVSVAADLLSGIASGIYDKGEAIVGAALGWLGSLVPGWAKKALEAFSPSRKMIPVGETIPEGIGVGILKGQPAMEKLAYEAGYRTALAYANGVNAGGVVMPLPGGGVTQPLQPGPGGGAVSPPLAGGPGVVSPPLSGPVIGDPDSGYNFGTGSFPNPQNVGGGQNFGGYIPPSGGAGGDGGGATGGYSAPNQSGGLSFAAAYDPNSPMQTPFHVARRQGVTTWAQFAEWVAAMQAKGYVEIVNGQPRFTDKYYTDVLGWVSYNGTLYNTQNAAQLNALSAAQGSGPGAAQSRSLAQAIEEGYVNGARRIMNGSRPSTQLVGG